MSNDGLDGLTEDIKKLRVEYEKYFMGLERLEPSKQHDEVKKELRRQLADPSNKSTVRRFRVQSLQATLVTYEAHWNRICRQIEEGTFKRDKLKASKKALETGPQAQAAPAQAQRQEGDYPAAIRQLYDTFERTRLDLGGTSKPVSIATLAATVQKQMAALKQQYNCKTVEFSVAVKDGKAILKAVPK